jgi:hypothetical protein
VSVNLEHRPLSVPEFLGGGMALATVALIAFGALRFAPSHNSPPAPANYAPVSIDSSEASIKSLVEQPRDPQPKVLSDVTAPAHDVQSPDSPLATGSSTPTPLNEVQAPPPPAADRSVAATARSPDGGPPIQQHGIETGSPGAVTDVAPLLNPPADSRAANAQRRNATDPPSARADPSFIGGWADDIGRCRTGRKAPLVINSRAAKTADGECAFGSVAREAANRWRVAAICASGGKFWRANIALKLTEESLTWSSERGTETYVRCKR